MITLSFYLRNGLVIDLPGLRDWSIKTNRLTGKIETITWEYESDLTVTLPHLDMNEVVAIVRRKD